MNLLTPFILLSLTSLSYGIELEASSDVAEVLMTTSGISCIENEKVTRSSFYLSPDRDPYLLKTRPPYERLGFMEQMGERVEGIAHALLHGDIARALPLFFVCTIIDEVKDTVCGVTTQYSVSGCDPNLTCPSTRKYNIMASGTAAYEQRSLIAPTKVESRSLPSATIF